MLYVTSTLYWDGISRVYTSSAYKVAIANQDFEVTKVTPYLLYIHVCCKYFWKKTAHVVKDSVKDPGGRLDTKMPSYQYKDPNVKDYKNPLHLDVVDRYLRRMGDKTIPDEAPPSLESFYPPWVAGIDLPQSRCCGFFVSFTNKHK